MGNQAFSKSALARHIHPIDFFKNKSINSKIHLDKLLCESFDIAQNYNNLGLNIKKLIIKNKDAYHIDFLEEKLILRKCTENISNNLLNKKKQRNQIVKDLICYLKEGTEYTIYKTDIKSFFESIDSNELISLIEKNENISQHTKNIVTNYIRLFNLSFSSGIPRGIEFSPILSELYLKSFDEEMINNKDIFYYARFVDDIIIIKSTYSDEHKFTKWITSHLPKGLFLNKLKTIRLTVSKRASPTKSTTTATFNFLGYQFEVIDTPLVNANAAKSVYRTIKLELTPKKIRELKTKISKSFFNYYKNQDFSLLKDRISFLTTNRELHHKDKNRVIPTGIYYNHSCLSNDSHSLIMLDKFLQTLLFSNNIRVNKFRNNSFSKEQSNELLKLSFQNGFKNIIYKNFSLSRLEVITRIWK